VRYKKQLAAGLIFAGVMLFVLAGCQGPVGPAGKNGTNGSDTSGFTLTPVVTTGGTISPSVPVKVDSGDLHMFIVKPDVFYALDSVTADGSRIQVQSGSLGYTAYVLNVTKDMTVKAWFSKRPIYYGMKLIPAGNFLMGAESTSPTAGTVNSNGDTIHQVTLSAFYMDSTDVTQREYRSLMGVNPSYFASATNWMLLPVETVTWFDAVLYCNARSRTEGKDTVYTFSYISGPPGNGCTNLYDLAIDYTKKGYRLPTESEWEYACKGGTTTTYWWGADTNGMGARAWTYYNSNNSTQPVATKLANAYGLYDMAGNVWQWCNDWYGSYGAGAATNPAGVSSGADRVVRGGSWYYDETGLRSADRGYFNPVYHNGSLGFRVVRPAQ